MNKRNAFMPELIDIICPILSPNDLLLPPSFSSPIEGIQSAETYIDSDYRVGEFEVRVLDSKIEGDAEELNLNQICVVMELMERDLN